METRLELIQAVLVDHRTSVFMNSDGVLLAPFFARDRMLNVYISLLEEERYIRWHIPLYHFVPEGEHREAVLLKLLELNHRYKVLKFGVDPVDGEVVVEASLYVGDAPLTEEQVERICEFMFVTAIEEHARIAELIATGVYPEEPEPEGEGEACDAEVNACIRRLLGDADEPDFEDEVIVSEITDEARGSFPVDLGLFGEFPGDAPDAPEPE